MKDCSCLQPKNIHPSTKTCQKIGSEIVQIPYKAKENEAQKISVYEISKLQTFCSVNSSLMPLSMTGNVSFCRWS